RLSLPPVEDSRPRGTPSMKLSSPRQGRLIRNSRDTPATDVAAIALMLLLGTLGPTKAAGALLFSAPFLSFDTESEPISVAIADLNADGRLDLAVACNDVFYFHGVSVLLGNGDGTFGAKTDFVTGGGPLSVAIADL